MRFKEIWMGILALVVMGAFIFDGYFIMSGEVKTADPQLLLLIGSVSGAAQTYCGLVLSYYFSSTKTSDEKNTTLANMVSKIPATQGTSTTTSTVTTGATEQTP